MKSNSMRYPPAHRRILSVWNRHFRVYTRNLFSNGLPPFLEPLIFLAGVGLGLGKYIDEMDGIPYLMFLATGLPLTAAMYTSAFEATYGTFIRLEFDKVYDGMLGAPLTAQDLLIGEIFWCGTKGFFFSCAVIIVMSLFGVVPLPTAFLAAISGFMTGLMFATLGFLVTSYVKTINHFNFFMTGALSPMFFFSGVIFPIADLPPYLRPAAELFPLTHSVRLGRALAFWQFETIHIFSLLYAIGFIILFGWWSIRRLSERLLS
ncbi:MAG: ABC transporter [Candidatus Cloacimonetes bacterium 4572_55]|nr:MAG: ABC transporter [Candidatus Cloacimonetes bacterium 4572_55]